MASGSRGAEGARGAAMKGANASTGALLRSFLERVERLEEERKQLADDIRDVKSEARAAGFDLKVFNQMLRERRMDRLERIEFEALCQVYRAALGMLDGTPLGDAARKRLMGEPESAAPPAEDARQAIPNPEPTIDLEGAHEAGRLAAREGKRIIDNPYIAGDPRRAAWDEGWCAETGTDGMEVPEAWRRKSKKQPPASAGDAPDEEHTPANAETSEPDDEGPMPTAPTEKTYAKKFNAERAAKAAGYGLDAIEIVKTPNGYAWRPKAKGSKPDGDGEDQP